MKSIARLISLSLCLVVALTAAEVPVSVGTVSGRNGVVVAGHPQAAAAGLEVLRAGGNAIDAAVATSLALGVAEPYGSGLGGKLILLFFEAKSGRTHVVEGLDAAGTGFTVEQFRTRPEEDRRYGYGSVCVPGLPAGLWLAHQRWGSMRWSETVLPAVRLARGGFEILPKSQDSFFEQITKLRRGDSELARLYLPGGDLPAIGTRLKNEDLARTMELMAVHGRDGFYRGPVADAILAASEAGGGILQRTDLENYEARITEPLSLDFRGYRLWAAPPPATGPAIFFTIMKVLEETQFSGERLRTPANLDLVGRVWRVVAPSISRTIADVESARFDFERLVATDSIKQLRHQIFSSAPKSAASGWPSPELRIAWAEEPAAYEDSAAATTHFVVADSQGNIVCATQSQSLHFGAGVVPPGTGVVMNNSMSNFAYNDRRSPNFVAPGKRPRSTISPTIVTKAAKPVLALGLPGAARIPTAMLQVLLDRLAFNRPLAEAIGDSRFHFSPATKEGEPDLFSAEKSLPTETGAGLTGLGWRYETPEVAGHGQYFGGINAIEFNADGTLIGFADPRRTNSALGY
jgi:gamma-glutamyltranspeptidase/glutathione hydrolase